MDELRRKLREDAARIESRISGDLDDRIRASLEGVAPERLRPRRPQRTIRFWLASSLTGFAAAVAVIAVINLPGRQAEVPPSAVSADGPGFDLPTLDLNVETAVLTTPLAEELEALQADLERAERAVRNEVPLSL